MICEMRGFTRYDHWEQSVSEMIEDKMRKFTIFDHCEQSMIAKNERRIKGTHRKKGDKHVNSVEGKI